MAVFAIFSLGVGLVRRRERPAVGWALIGVAAAVAIVLAGSGHPRAVLILVWILGFGIAMEVDRPGQPARRALALLSIGVGFFALCAAGVYAS